MGDRQGVATLKLVKINAAKAKGISAESIALVVATLLAAVQALLQIACY